MTDMFLPELEIKLEVYDPRGKPVAHSRFEARSWLMNFYRVLEMLFAPHLLQPYLDPYGETFSVQCAAFFGNRIWDDVIAGTTEIGVGNSSTAFNKNHNKLQGSTVYWGALNEFKEESGKAKFKASIACTNALTVKEVGFRWSTVKDTGGTNRIIMFERSVLASADQVDVPAGGSVIATYEMNLP